MVIFFFMAPVMTSSYFHFHHWFAGWLIGMHANFDVWWSRAAMAYCWVSMEGISGRRRRVLHHNCSIEAF